MNFKNFFFAILFSVILTISSLGNISRSKDSSLETFTASTNALVKLGGEYTYVRVFKDGIWWIYVYDGAILIDEYPED